ncbi:UDP-glycosyltransferase 90A1 [Ricinus communis]|uniref:UDP-glycosyltransferase 90A1 n=1 Tax=Ricinus communis TaxID=3988 RepID=UPI0007728A2A|nr:UDP-glycosyltransferase 90A1 [Ricinus communis]|eukprot:XP_015573632.1 UDP-glycosyltransferase 90A1 [Ricinus communis]
MSSQRQNLDSKSCESSQYHIALFPFMSKGHTIPLLHLAHLLFRRGIAVTVFTTHANHPFIADFLSNTAASIIDLAFPDNIPEIPSGVESTDKLPSMSLFPPFALATKLMQPDFDEALKSLPLVNFMVSDGFLWWTADSAMKFGIPRLIFYGMSNYSSCVAKSAAECNHLFGPESADDLITLTEFPWIKVTKNDFEPVFLNPEPKGPHFEFILKTVIASSISYGYLSNSFYELESVFVDHWNKHNKQKTWCVGPLCLAGTLAVENERQKKPTWILWLDEKLKQGSAVLYVAFGSQAEISTEQLKDIAIGLEESKVNFLWVIRKEESELGDGFEDRVKERGIIIREWVDQMEILMHPSVEGYLSHCGWNSVLESICAGVPILAWPMMAEQPLNARMVVEEIKVGLRVETCNGSVRGFVKWEALRKMVNELMNGEMGKEVRNNVKKYAEVAMKAMEVGAGSSWGTLDMLIEEICN